VDVETYAGCAGCARPVVANSPTSISHRFQCLCQGDHKDPIHESPPCSISAVSLTFVTFSCLPPIVTSSQHLTRSRGRLKRKSPNNIIARTSKIMIVLFHSIHNRDAYLLPILLSQNLHVSIPSVVNISHMFRLRRGNIVADIGLSVHRKPTRRAT
jgi:hypothetical protein